MSQESFEDQVKRERAIVRAALNTPAGRELLGLLTDQHVWNSAMHPETNVVFFRLGQQELVKQLIEICEASDE